MSRLYPADIATLIGGFLAASSIPAAIMGDGDLAVRLLLLSYALDVVDGWLARRYGSSEDGFFLDRAFDRLGQVVGPGVLLLSWTAGRVPDTWYLAYSAYFAGFAVVAYYRLVRRGVRSLSHFSGLPLFVHAIILLASYISRVPPNPLLLLVLLGASALPVPYPRRTGKGGGPSPAFLPRLAGLLLLAGLPYDNSIVVSMAKLVLVLMIAYAAVGPIMARSARPS